MVSKTTYDYIVKLLGDGLNVNFVSNYMNVDVKLVDEIASGSYVRVNVRVVKSRRSGRTKSRELAPITMPPFPDLTALDDHQRIIVLTKRGLAASKIRRYLRRPITAENVARYARRVLGPAPTGINNSRANLITVSDMPYVLEAMRRMGKDRYRCEVCLDPVPRGCMVHHTKYQGATAYDLMFVCGSCNQSRVNKGLV